MRIPMYNPYQLPIWKTSPFVRLLAAFIAGILLQWYLHIPIAVIVISLVCFTCAYVLFLLLPLSLRFKIPALQGMLINLILISAGMFITWQKDIRNDSKWFANYYHNGDQLVVRINEPLVEKPRSYKASGYIEAVIDNGNVVDCKGKALIYFSKDTATQQLQYGDKIFINKGLQPIKNSGNPGAFDQEQYGIFQQTLHTVYLKDSDWALLPEKNANLFRKFIFGARQTILSIIKKYVKGNEGETGIAEALLLGYTNDLDKSLQQAYTNTGVVHLIAISGMPLGLIYLMLSWIFSRMPFIKKSVILKSIATLGCLWLFALLTGGSASVLRSVIVLTCIIIGTSFFKKPPVYNSLAASAFILLCCNPCFLWDVGFQFSYLVVLSIVVFQQPVYHAVYIKNKWGDKLWRAASFALAAQVLTFPICIYYFHQFPILFLLTNMVAAPLSTVILFSEILLVAFSWVPHVSIYLGKITLWLIGLMNKFILWVNGLPFSFVDKLPSSLVSTLLLYAIVISFSAWLLNRNKTWFRFSLLFILLFTMQFAYNSWSFKEQKKIIVYNIPKHRAIDFVDGNNYRFVSDSILSTDPTLQNIFLEPSRMLFQLNKETDTLPSVFRTGNFYQFENKRILLIDSSASFQPSLRKIDVDMIVVSGSPKLYIPQLVSIFNCKLYAFDASNSLWKIDGWKKDCEQLHLPFYSIPDEGAFVLNANE